MIDIKILENRSEIGAGTRGAGLGIDAIKTAALKKGSKFFRNIKRKRIKTENALLYSEIANPFAKHIDGILKIYQKVSAEIVNSMIKENCFPIVLSGDHSSAGGTIAGIKMANPKKRLGVIWIDAHADIHSPYTTPSGNMHGMPVCVSLGMDNLDKRANNVKPETEKLWEELKNIGGICPKILPEDLVYIGVRSAEEPEEYLIDKYKIKDFWMKDVTSRGTQAIVDDTLNHLKNCDIIYISFDVDSMDPAYSSGTGTSVPFGLSVGQAIDLLRRLLASDKVCCFEITEVNPTLDSRNFTAENAFIILESAAEVIKERLNREIPVPGSLVPDSNIT